MFCNLFSIAFGASSSNTSTKTDGGQYLKTTSLLTCMANSQFSASYFDVHFYRHNNTVTFKVDATTTISGKVIVRADVIVYGLNVIQKTIDLCSLGQVALCPLSAGRIDVSSSYTIDSDIIKQIPGVAYTIPDLDAQVRVVVYSQNDTTYQNPLACVEAIVSNDKTVQTKYASWPIAAISGLGVLTSGFVSVLGYTSTSAHIASNSISLFIYFQNLSITAMMGVARVPPIAAAWTQNFQWSMGIINVGFMQSIFDWYVQATKGTSTAVLANKDVLSISVQKREFINQMIKKVTLASSNDYTVGSSIANDTHLYTTDERNSTDYASKILLLHGMERVAYKANIELSNFFLTGIVFFLFFIFVLVVCMIFFKALLEVLTRARIMSETSNFFLYRKNWGSLIKGTLFRLAIIAFPQVSLLTIWEFTQIDSPAIVVDAVVVLVVISGLLIYGTIRVLIRGQKSWKLYKTPAYLLYGDTSFLNRFGFLYAQFNADKYWWLIPLLSYAFLRSLFVAVLQNQGKAQALIIFIIELFYFIALCWFKPYLDKRTNIFNIFIHVVNLINSLIFLFFSNLFKQPAIVSSVLAVVLFVLNAVVALFLLIFTIVTCTLALIHRNPDARYEPMKDDRVSFIPKIQTGADGTTATKSETQLFDMRKAVMETNESEKLFDSDNKSDNMTRERLIFDDGSSTNSYNGNRVNSYTGFDSQPLEPTSVVRGGGNSGGAYLSVPDYQRTNRTRSGSNLQKPETSFFSR
ncbi:hypothetical protein TBLA_0A04380 [Henningerozyma blattae CBS 6284]|uniref:ML-like domain-containing protein n=1 Tax=Henningerozyma blattae (strain ATCC 34711 / CBS 6284 / DSM 70876 / NBRC 10599 / NRRL Y-10934 / UCD 77-7) TaxID=1071380 RepID=I2GVT1_HENB6|nr:hypothetical protein TBLA_0A04380 [Tetrapisispora blattae CBS 6284]CCH58233.1 hypothetical protein TBLA_0A04380 [Tetrapisispora blattae CBS 6284]